jgi:alkaline phosphatase
MPVTGQVMTYALNALITDSSPGMSSYVTGTKGANNQTGVFPDDTTDPFDNPRIEYFGEMLRRTRGPGFNVGIVTTADVTDSTPAGNAVHTGDRGAGPGIAAQFLDERATNGVSVLMGGGARHFLPPGAGSTRKDDRDLVREFETAGYARIATATDMRTLLARPKLPPYILGLFNPGHMTVAFDKVGVGRYSDELAQEKNAALRDQPMLDDMARLALRALTEHSPRGFYLMIEGASIDKRAHDTDAERMIWDAIEFDHAVGVALEFARRTNTDRDPDNDTLVIVTADHECGGLGIVGVGNERYAPSKLGKAVRDYAAVFRFQPENARLDLFPSYEVDAAGFPVDPDPSRKLLLGWAAGPDRYENWLANRRQLAGATRRDGVSVANPERDGPGDKIPGFPVSGVIENGANACTPDEGCPADTSSVGHTIAGHTATDVPLSAEGPGAYQFTGTYNNTDVMLKLLRATTGAYPDPLGRPAQRAGDAAKASLKAGSGSR